METIMKNDLAFEHDEQHSEFIEGCSTCYNEEKCHECHDTGVVYKDEWVEENDSYEVAVKCECQYE